MKNKKLSVSFIGAGKVATALGELFFKNGIQINEIYSTTLSSTKKLAKKLNAKPIHSIKELNGKSDFYILAINDDAIEKVAGQLQIKDKIVVHTSGTTAIQSLKSSSKNIGVFYPLQTFTKQNSSGDFPILIEASNEKTLKVIKHIATSISKDVRKVNSKQRLKIHLAAVLVSNFTNQLYALAHDLLKKEKIDFNILLPLITQVNENLKKSSPDKNQTGPAIRRDKKTIDKHLKLIQKEKDLKMIYQMMTSSIQKKHKK